MARTQRAVSTLVIAVASLLVLTSCAKREAEIKVGEYGSLTGGTATFGTSSKNGIELFVDNLNAQGGIGGRKIHVLVEDDQSKPEEAATAVNKLIAQDGVVAVLGEVASSRSLAAAPICQNASVPMISPSSTNPKVTEIGDYIFRVCYIDPFQGMVIAKFAKNTLHFSKAAILRDNKNDYSVGLANYFAEAFKGMGGTIVADEAYAEGDQDFKAQLTNLKGKKPEFIFVPGYYTEVGLIARQARELGITVPMLGGDGWVSERLLEVAQDALNGSYFVNHYYENDPNPIVQNFVQSYRKRYNSTPDGLAALAYDAAGVLTTAMQQLLSADPKAFETLSGPPNADQKAARAKLRELIAATRDYAGVTGRISLDEHRNAVKPAVFVGIENRAYKLVATVEP
ncbi:MAG TPA: ABC transporter substrate-binding protein [Candidatus Limnocylindrales bacterium]|nr:ABC transporter substrate-binding protein [Candidatus Limnocylindrales bacterium]